MVPWTQLREPCLRRMWTDLISELTYFNPVIRLSETVGLSVFHLFATSRRSCCPFRSPWNLHLFVLATVPNNQKLLFPAAASAFDVIHDMSDRRQQACPLPAGVVPLVFGEVKHFVHLIRWNSYSRLIPSGTTGPRSRRGVTHDL